MVKKNKKKNQDPQRQQTAVREFQELNKLIEHMTEDLCVYQNKKGMNSCSGCLEPHDPKTCETVNLQTHMGLSNIILNHQGSTTAKGYFPPTVRGKQWFMSCPCVCHQIHTQCNNVQGENMEIHNKL